MSARELLDPEQVRLHADTRALGIAPLELAEDRVVLRLGAVDGAALGHGPDDPRPLGAADQVSIRAASAAFPVERAMRM